MMLHCGDDDFIPGTEVAPAITLRNQVYPLGRSAHKNDLFERFRIDEMLDFLACAFVGVCRQFAQGMHAAMDIGIVRAIIFIQCLDDLARLLCRCRIVQVHQGLAAYGLLEDWEIRAVALHREIGNSRRIFRYNLWVIHYMNSSIRSESGNSPAMLCSRRSRISGNLISRITSSANA